MSTAPNQSSSNQSTGGPGGQKAEGGAKPTGFSFPNFGSLGASATSGGFPEHKTQTQKESVVAKVPITELANHIIDKSELYYCLRVKAGVFLPDVHTGIPVLFLKQLLSKNKLYLTTHEVVICTIPRYQELTVQKVYDLVKLQFKTALKYLPDAKVKAGVERPYKVDKHWFFSILNTIAPDFFPNALQKIEGSRLEVREKADKFVEVDSVLLAAIQEMTAKFKSKAKNKKGLFALRHGSKKRKFPVFKAGVDISDTLKDQGQIPNPDQQGRHPMFENIKDKRFKHS